MSAFEQAIARCAPAQNEEELLDLLGISPVSPEGFYAAVVYQMMRRRAGRLEVLP